MNRPEQQRATRLERWKTVMRMRSRGATYAEIGEAIGTGPQRALQITEQAQRAYERGVSHRLKTVALLPRHMRAHYIFERPLIPLSVRLKAIFRKS